MTFLLLMQKHEPISGSVLLSNQSCHVFGYQIRAGMKTWSLYLLKATCVVIIVDKKRTILKG